jgi:hypothetical protein
MLDGVSILRSEKVKDELVLDGNDVELVSRSAALINQVIEQTDFLDASYHITVSFALFMRGFPVLTTLGFF